MNTEQNLKLPDGRNLCYAEYGDANGFPVMYFHGAPSSRLEPKLLGDGLFCKYGLHVIAPDRPGMGKSTFQPGRGFSDWSKDVAALADFLGWKKFSVFGNSGGSPYTAVCAAKIPQRIHSAVIASGAWRMDWPEVAQNLPFPNRMIWSLAKRVPFILGPLLKMMSSSSTKAPTPKSLEQMKKTTPEADFEVLMRPGMQEGFVEMSTESMRQGTRGIVWDICMFVRDWDFSLDEIRMPVTLFHGSKDRSVPAAVARKAASLLPAARLIEYEKDAHVSTPINHFAEIVEEIKK